MELCVYNFLGHQCQNVVSMEIFPWKVSIIYTGSSLLQKHHKMTPKRCENKVTTPCPGSPFGPILGPFLEHVLNIFWSFFWSFFWGIFDHLLGQFWHQFWYIFAPWGSFLWPTTQFLGHASRIVIYNTKSTFWAPNVIILGLKIVFRRSFLTSEI